MELIPEKSKKHLLSLELTEDNAREIMKKLEIDIILGLGAKTHKKATVKCFITYVQDLPTGQEKGTFLALDFGGINFRVLVITIDGGSFDMESKEYAVPQEVMKGSFNMLFDYLASCLSDFAYEQDIADMELSLGFTFSFPLAQHGLTKGILERWHEGFNVSGVVGKDVVHLLEEALKRRGDLKIKIAAVLNDTTGILMSSAWKNPHCKIGFVIGNGCNACYMEKIENVELFDGDKSKPCVIINTECGAFGDDGSLNFVRTDIDREVDKKSINKGKQILEKMISGTYMGILVKIIVCKLAKEKVLFGGKVKDDMKKKAFTTKMMCEIAMDLPGTFENARNIMSVGFGYPDITNNECAIIQLVCQKVTERSAHMCAACLSTLINRIGDAKITVGVDGSLYRFHPYFQDLMVKYMTPLVNPGIEFDLLLSEDGRGRGAALVAATASSSSSIE